ncbi:MAG: superoxide dismutase [Kiritimatiellia bacterium]
MNESEIKLPFATDALNPVLSPDAVDLHYRGHHLGYARTLSRLLPGTPFEGRPLTAIIAGTRGSGEYGGIFNNAAQVWNHSFFWESLAPVDAGGRPVGRFLKQIERDYGTFEALKRQMAATAAKRFGSGWLWLTDFHGRIEVTTTANAETPVATPGVRPILTVDLWEHAYYLNWRNRRADYVDAVLNRLVNWSAASTRFGA